MKNKEINLKKLKSRLRKKEAIPLTNNKLIEAQKLEVTKNTGNIEKFSIYKIEKMANWACDNNKYFVKMLIDETSIKLYNKIKTIEIQDQLVKTAENLISRLQPEWEYIAAKLFLIKLYKIVNSNNGNYPTLEEYVKKGLRHKILNQEVYNSYTQEELLELNIYLKKDRDYNFTIKGIKTFYNKYLLKTPSNKKIIELPQLTYMRVAMGLHWKKSGKQRIEIIKKLYDLLSLHQITMATPILLNAGTINMQLASCVLNKVADDSISIMDVNKDLAIYSKFKGGTSLDIDAIRASECYIDGNQGISSGPVPFIKITEQIMKAWNQGGIRPGACAVYFSFWHYNFEQLIVLKNNGGIEENRARGLKYVVKFNNLFIDRWINNENITLFSPQEVPLLTETFGDTWEKAYKKYEKTPGILKKKIPARDLWKQFIKERSETGNIYLFYIDNVNNQNMLKKMITQSNLCLDENTLIQTKNGIKKIKDITNKDYVKTYDIYKKTITYEKVLEQILSSKNAKVLEIIDEHTNKKIICTPDHAIWTKNRGYIFAKYLKNNDKLLID